MTKSEFEVLLQRYMRGECTEQEKDLIQIWFKKIESENEFDTTEEERRLIEGKILSEIDDRINASEGDNQNGFNLGGRLNSLLIYTGIAASLILTIFLTRNNWKTMENSVTQSRQAKQTTGNVIVTKTNNAHGCLKVVLDDGSIVYLMEGSNISYKSHFEKDKRVVQLTGSGLFQVVKNPKKPFFVLCGGTVTRVIGTSFWVNTDQKSKSVEIGVKTGKVSVFVHEDNKGTADTLPRQSDQIFLTQNQRVVFFEQKRKVEKTLVTQPILLETPEVARMKFVYNETPLSTVIQELGQSYGVQMMMPDKNLLLCSFTGDLTDMTFREKLDLVCKSVGSKYSIEGTSIILTGNGCK